MISSRLGFVPVLTIALGTIAGLASAQENAKKGPAGPPMTMTIPAFKDGSELPVKFSCSNAPAGVSPQIQWSNPPKGTESFVMLLHDPEPHPQKGMYDVTHWLMWNIPASSTGLPEGVPGEAQLSDGARQGKGPRGTVGYFGPCAPPGIFHHYTFELYALDSKLDVGADAGRADVMKAMDGHVLGAAVYITLFHR